MRNIILSLVALFLTQPVLPQNNPSKAHKPVKNQMLAGINEAANELNKQIIDLERQKVEAKKNNEEESTIKDLEDQISMLKKQVVMMGGLRTNLSVITEKTFKQAGEQQPLIPRRDIERINKLPGKILSDSGLYVFIKKVHADAETIILPAERTTALQIYLETKARYKSVAEINNAAAGCWIYGHWEKALWLSGKACLDSMADPDNLNNYASYLTMIGGEQAALPILQYLNKKYPTNSTVFNNMGQAWFGLGDIPNAKKFLDSAIVFFPDHSTANLTLSNIYLHQGDSVNAIASLRRSIRTSFTIEKTARLEGMGVELDDDDIEFDYPMDEDPFGFEPFFDEFPSIPGGVAETPRSFMEWEAFKEATRLFAARAGAEEDVAQIRTKTFIDNMADSSFQQPVLKLHNSHVNIKAGRKLAIGIRKRTALSIDEVMNMMANVFHEVTSTRLNALEKKRQEDLKHADGCEGGAAVNNSFMSEAKTIIDEGSAAMRTVYLQNKKKIHTYIKLTAYSSLNDYNERMEKFHEEIWKKNQWILTYTARFASAFKSLRQTPQMFTNCGEKPEVPKVTRQLPPIKTPDCIHAVSLNLPVGGIKEECNTCTIDESKLKHSTAQGPQKQESVDPSKTTTIECNKSGSVKIDRARPGSKQRCTVNSDRSNLLMPLGSQLQMVGSRLGLAR